MQHKHVRHFAPVVPLSIAQFLKGHDALGGYHLLLAHDVLANPDAYRATYAGATDIIMDNSLIELGYPMRVRDVIEAARVVNAQKVVLPDVLGSLEETLTLVQQAYEDFYMLPLDVTAGLKMVAVVQGESREECSRCLHEYSKLGVEISIPRVLVSILGSRMDVIREAYSMGFRNMHLLGFSDNLIDDVSSVRMPGVKGIDSAVPIRAGVKGLYMALDDMDFSKNLGPRGSYWETDVEKMNAVDLSTICSNLYSYRKWINC